MRSLRALAVLAAAFTSALVVRGTAATGGARGAPAVTGPPPRILVVIVVDQLAAWMAEERWPTLPPDGGFARLRREGLYARELRFGSAATDTAPGHSALFTGAVPHESGILANEVIPAGGGDPVSFLADPTTRTVMAEGGPGVKASSSLAALRVETLADVLASARPDAAIVSLSLKDRGALFGAGRHPTAALWLDPELGAFVTSTAITSRFPDWAAHLGDGATVRAAMARGWQLGDRAWVAAHAETADDAAGEAAYQGLGRTFPHAIGSVKALRATPEGDALLFELASAAAAQIEAARGRPGLLALSLSSHDYIAHLFGPHSWEAWDELAKLDHALAGFLARLDQLFGEDNYAVMLTGDHGSNALPELSRERPSPWCRGAAGRPDHWERSCAPRQRLIPSAVVPALEGALGEALGAARGPFVAGIADPLVFLTPRGRDLPAADERTLVRVATDFLRHRFAIAHVVDLRSAPARCPALADESWRALVCRGTRAGGPGDLYMVVSPGTFFDPRLAPGAGTSHGSPYLYDRAVPLLIRAPGRVRPGEVRQRPVAFTAFARTAAALLDVRPPEAAADGEDLTRL